MRATNRTKGVFRFHKHLKMVQSTGMKKCLVITNIEAGALSKSEWKVLPEVGIENTDL